MGNGACRLGLYDLRAADFEAVGCDAGIVGHVLGLKRRRPESFAIKQAAQAGGNHTFPHIRGSSQHGNGFRDSHGSYSVSNSGWIQLSIDRATVWHDENPDSKHSEHGACQSKFRHKYGKNQAGMECWEKRQRYDQTERFLAVILAKPLVSNSLQEGSRSLAKIIHMLQNEVI